MFNLDSRFENALSNFDGENFELLPKVDQILIAIWAIEAEVNNGGFDRFYFNSSGDVAYFAPTALKAVGANHMAEIALQANTVFGTGGPPRFQDERRSALQCLTHDGSEPWDTLDRAFQAYPDDIRKLLEDFLKSEGAI